MFMEWSCRQLKFHPKVFNYIFMGKKDSQFLCTVIKLQCYLKGPVHLNKNTVFCLGSHHSLGFICPIFKNSLKTSHVPIQWRWMESEQKLLFPERTSPWAEGLFLGNVWHSKLNSSLGTLSAGFRILDLILYVSLYAVHSSHGNKLAQVGDSQLRVHSHSTPHVLHNSTWAREGLSLCVIIKSILTFNDTETVLQAYISSRLDNRNCVFTCRSQKSIDRLQTVQNSAAWLSTRRIWPRHSCFSVFTLAPCAF